MREAIGSTWIFSLVITFTLIFAGFLVLALSYSKAYKIKNEMTSMIEKYEGVTTLNTDYNEGSLNIMNQYILNSGYNAKGKCPIGSHGVDNLQDNTIVEINDTNASQKYYYCISYDTDIVTCSTLFKITVFYDFNLPVLGQLGKFSISGQTNEIYNAHFKNSTIAC